MTDQAAEQPEARPFLPRWALYLAVPGLVGPLLILGFIFVSETAHNESRCPYEPVEVRPLSAALSVREDRRNCLGSIEERRFTAVRGANERILGRRRFDRQAFGQGYDWTASVSPEGEVKVTVHNPNHTEATFREGTPADEAKP